MTTVDEIAAAVSRLTPADRADLLHRLELLREAEAVDGDDAWDRQMRVDAAAGKLDRMVAAAKGDHVAGRTRALP